VVGPRGLERHDEGASRCISISSVSGSVPFFFLLPLLYFFVSFLFDFEFLFLLLLSHRHT
jgi:hypothetical protein